LLNQLDTKSPAANLRQFIVYSMSSYIMKSILSSRLPLHKSKPMVIEKIPLS